MQAAAERGALGGSIYDYVTTPDDLWAARSTPNGLEELLARSGLSVGSGRCCDRDGRRRARRPARLDAPPARGWR